MGFLTFGINFVFNFSNYFIIFGSAVFSFATVISLHPNALYNSPLISSGPVALFFFLFFKCLCSSVCVISGYCIGVIVSSISYVNVKMMSQSN